MMWMEIAKEVAEELGLPEQLVRRTYVAYWKYIRNVISSLPLKEELTEDEFSKLNTNINVVSLGKFHCSYDRYRKIKKKFQYIENLRKRKDDSNIKED